MPCTMRRREVLALIRDMWQNGPDNLGFPRALSREPTWTWNMDKDKGRHGTTADDTRCWALRNAGHLDPCMMDGWMHGCMDQDPVRLAV
ncbi:hypothetical protein E4U55_001341 [Claviceps digitariae]|nr:hypothetical protein E4U55_001341 [Claviceps digitariae]